MASEGLYTPIRKKRTRWQFSLFRLLAVMTVLCIGLAVLRLGAYRLDRRSIPFVVTALVLVFSKGVATRGAALGGIGGLCIGLLRFDEWRAPLSDEFFTLAATGACGGWFGAAFQATSRGHETIGLVALFSFFVWFTFWFCS